MFQPSSIQFNRFKWVYIIAASRCFSSSWGGVSQMIPFADQINHENVNVTYDCKDPTTGEYFPSQEQLDKIDDAVRKDKQSMKERQIIKDFREEITDMNEQLDLMQLKLEGNDPAEQAQEDKPRAKQAKEEEVPTTTYLNQEEWNNEKEPEKEEAEDDADYADLSSGLESDHEFDLLVEQEVLTAIAMRRQKKAVLPSSAFAQNKDHQPKEGDEHQ